MNSDATPDIPDSAQANANLDNVFQCIPSERIEPYVRRCEGDRRRALSLYAWNTSASGAMYEVMGHFEVMLRNAIDSALASRHNFKKRSGDWLDNNHGELSDKAAETINAAREEVRHNGKPVTRGAIIAELNFGFWIRLLDRRYESKWGSAVMRTFPKLKRPNNNDMDNLRTLVEPIYKLRNRVAHHEPIWYINISNREADMLQCIRFINEDMAVWTTSASRLRQVLDSCPAPASVLRR